MISKPPNWGWTGPFPEMAFLWYMWVTNLLNGMILQVGQWLQEELAATKRRCPSHHLDGCLDILSIFSIVVKLVGGRLVYHVFV